MFYWVFQIQRLIQIHYYFQMMGLDCLLFKFIYIIIQSIFYFKDWILMAKLC